MNTNDTNIFKSLIKGGLIGATLGALLYKNREEGVTIGALAGAVILATYKANIQAQKTNIPVYVEEEGKLYEIQPGGSKHFIKDLPKSKVLYNKHFKLK